jgi:hypothetical protein
MTTCHPDLAYTAVKLSQSNSCPAEHHYHSLMHTIWYLYATRLDNIYFWCTRSRSELPDGPLLMVNSNLKDLLLDDRPNMMPLLLLRTATLTGPPVSRPGIRLALPASASNSQVAPLHTKPSFNRLSPCPLLKLNLWRLVTLTACRSLSSASSGTSMFLRKQQQLPMKIAMAALQWGTLRNPQPALITSILNILHLQMGRMGSHPS